MQTDRELFAQFLSSKCNVTQKQTLCELTNRGFFPERKQYLNDYDYANQPDTIIKFDMNEIYGGFCLVLGIITILGEIVKYL